MRPLLSFLLLFIQLMPGKARAAGSGDNADQPVNVGSRLELFVDDYLIEKMVGASLKLHQPLSAGRVLLFDKDWEGNTSTYVTVFKDENRFRMYYRGSNTNSYLVRSWLNSGEATLRDHPSVIAIAESSDGIHWTRPALGLYEFQGSSDNNIVWMDKPGEQKISDCMFVFKDSNPAAPADSRYKALGGNSRPLVSLISPDGLRWRELQGQKSLVSEGLHANAFDALNVAFWDPLRSLYVLIFRDADTGTKREVVSTKAAEPNYGNRSLKYAASRDFKQWSAPQWVDFGNAPAEHLYTNATTPYFRAPHVYLAFPKRFLPWRSFTEESPLPGVSEGVFMSSRDGLHWDRRFMEAFVRPGRDRRNWTHRNNMIAAGVVPTATDEISLYVVRNYNFPSAHVERLVLRTDGFVSVHAGYQSAELVTKALIFEGGKLVLNYATSASGSIRLEVQDLSGNPLPGFSLEDSPTIWGDEIEGRVTWRRYGGKAALNPLKHLEGKPVRLRFVLRDADLFSLRFSN